MPIALVLGLPWATMLHSSPRLQVFCFSCFKQLFELPHKIRAERKKEQVCSPLQYEKVFKRLKQLPETVEHIVVQLGQFNSSFLWFMFTPAQAYLLPIRGWCFWKKLLNLTSIRWLRLEGQVAWACPDLSINSIMKPSCWMTLYVGLKHVPRPSLNSLLQNDHWTASNHKVREHLTPTIKSFMSHFRKNGTGLLNNCNYLQRCRKSEWPFYLATFIVQPLVSSRPSR